MLLIVSYLLLPDSVMDNISLERYNFRRMQQEPKQSFGNFVERLQCQMAKCEYRSPDENLFDQIVEKCSNEKLRTEAFRRKLTLSELISIGKELESAEFCRSSATSFRTLCTRCGSKNHDYKNPNCPALGVNCSVCKKRGHYARECRSKRAIQNDYQILRSEPTRKRVNEHASSQPSKNARIDDSLYVSSSVHSQRLSHQNSPYFSSEGDRSEILPARPGQSKLTAVKLESGNSNSKDCGEVLNKSDLEPSSSSPDSSQNQKVASRNSEILENTSQM